MHAIEYHQKVMDGILSGDAELSRRAMDDHMDQTYQDYERYVHAAPVLTAARTSRVLT